MTGWWKFHRKMLDHPVFQLPGEQFKVWCVMCSLANHDASEWWDGKSRVQLLPGQFISSQDHLAEKSFTSRQTVRTVIKNLLRLESISTNTLTNRYTLITVINWATYSGDESQPNQQPNHSLTNHQPTANQPLTTAGECKKEKKVKNSRRNTLLANPNGFAAFWSAYPRKVGKAPAEKAWNRINPQNGLVESIISALVSQIPTWSDPQYIPHPATWLNGRRWEDVLIAPTKTTKPMPDLKALWKSQEEYLVHLKAGRVAPKHRVTEWEPTPTQ